MSLSGRFHDRLASRAGLRPEGDRPVPDPWRRPSYAGTNAPVKVSEIARALEAQVEGDGELEIEEIAPLDQAEARSLSFLSNPKYAPLLPATRAGAVILGPDVIGPGCTVLRVTDAYRAFARAVELFDRPVLPPPGIDRAAMVDETATIGPGAHIAAGVHVGSGARIGARARLFPGVVIYPEAEIGDDFTAHARAVVRERVRIGDRVVLGVGSVIGGEGFGYIPLPGGGVERVRQIGTVELGDEVEIGANTTIDRAAIGATRVERGAKLDNLVMIAHGCRIGPEALIAAQTGLAGSTIIGARTQLGGQVGAAGHIRVGDDVRAAAKAGIANDIEAGSTVAGHPAVDAGLWRRMTVVGHRLPDLLRRVRRLERALGRERSGGAGGD